MTDEQDSTYSLIKETTYFDSIRSSGYKSTAKALAEIIDNSIQAGASQVDVRFEMSIPEGRRKSVISKVYIIDNGEGMTAKNLREGLRIGGRDIVKSCG